MPFKLRDCSPHDLVADGQKRKGFCVTANETLKESHAYHYQVQAQLHLSLDNIKKCYFYLHAEGGGHLAVVERDESFIETHKDSLKAFVKDTVLPRVILGNAM